LVSEKVIGPILHQK